MQPTPTGPDRARRREVERRRRRVATIRLALIALLLVGLVGAAFAIGRSSGGSGDEQPVVTDCVQRDATLDKWPPEGWEDDAVVTGPVAFVGARDAVREDTEEGGGVKTELPVLVDAEEQVTIRTESDDAQLGFGEQQGGSRAVTLKACPEHEREFGTSREVGPFTQFVGTFSSTEPSCVELDVHVLGEREPRRARIGIGKEC